jgi:transcriptional regulator with XRE-family HTH domain
MGEHEPELVAFGKRLRAVRKEHGVSRRDLAFRTGMYETEIGRYERGGRDPRLATILRLARGLGVPPGALLDPLA